MKCFIHPFDDAISVCKLCGKAMCMNCSAYSEHSGICPECRKNAFIEEHKTLVKKIKSIKISTCVNLIFAALSIFVAILFAVQYGSNGLIILIVTALLGLRAFKQYQKINPLKQRADYLDGEIKKLNLALQKGMAII